MRVLIATDNRETITQSYSFFESDVELVIAGNRLSAQERILSEHFDLCYYDLNFFSMPGTEPQDFLDRILSEKPSSKIIVLNHKDRIQETLKLVSNGALNYITFPIDSDEIKVITKKEIATSRQQAELEFLRSKFWSPDSLDFVKTQNTKMDHIYQMLENVAPTSSTVLLTGETGVGKSLIARLIHQHSSRKTEQFIHIHCGAIAENLIESELFGHEKGAFTGAIKKKLGKFELAHKGTIFLDEVSTLTPSAQIKLLQVMQDSLFQRVGGESDIKVNVRIIAATNDNLKKMSDEGSFRKDLFYRLNVFPVEIPPLRERKEDILEISETILKKMQQKNSKTIEGFQEEVQAALKSYSWPGNIRELENIIERAYILEKSKKLSQSSFPIELFSNEEEQAILPINLNLPLSEARNRSVELFEKQYLIELLSKTKGKIGPAAEQAGITSRQLNNLMNKYQIEKSTFKI